MTSTRALTDFERKNLETKSEGRCMFCRSKWGSNRRGHVEFDPATGEPRFLLCRDCFGTLNDFNHDLERLQRAVTLLEAA